LKSTFCAQLIDRISLDAAVALLPAGSRKIFLKFDVEGYNHEEIAGLIGCSVGNSKSQLHKARRKLRRLLRLNGSVALKSGRDSLPDSNADFSIKNPSEEDNHRY
jgi:hypothetical protein